MGNGFAEFFFLKVKFDLFEIIWQNLFFFSELLYSFFLQFNSTKLSSS